MWTLTIEDLTHLGGPMGTEYTTSTDRHFASSESAKAAAVKHYNGSDGPLKWRKHRKGWTSGDLGYVMYTIQPMKIEK